MKVDEWCKIHTTKKFSPKRRIFFIHMKMREALHIEVHYIVRGGESFGEGREMLDRLVGLPFHRPLLVLFIESEAYGKILFAPCS